MCIKCLIENLVVGKRPTEVVGTVSKDLAAAFKEHGITLETFKIDHEIRVLQLRRNFIAGDIGKADANELQREYNAMVEYEEGRMENTHKELWNRLYDELNITEAERKATYEVDHDTGEVVKYIERDIH